MTVDVLFLNDAPVVRYGLATGFEALERRVAFFGEHLWTMAKGAQVACVKHWMAMHGVPRIVFFEGFTGVQPISPEALSFFKQAGAQFYYWAIEDPLWTAEVIALDGRLGPYAMVADHIFTPAIECARRYLRWGRRSSLLPFAMNPQFHRPVDANEKFRCDVVLVANHYESRSLTLLHQMIRPALEVAQALNACFRLYGHGWENVKLPDHCRDPRRGALDYWNLPEVYSGSKIALGAEQCLNASETQCSMRVFEVMGSGACYLGPRHRAHERMFDETELVFSDDPAATKYQLARLLRDENARKSIADAGRRRCLAQHTYADRAGHVLTVLSASNAERGTEP